MNDRSRVLYLLKARRASEASGVTNVRPTGGEARITHLYPSQAKPGMIAIEFSSASAGGSSPFRNPLAPIAPNPPERALVPVIGANDELLPAFERAIAPVAHLAWTGDRTARDALYAAFEPKLMRFTRAIHTPYAPEGDHGVWERQDVVQDAYLAFTDVIQTWNPSIPFGRYVFAHYPWRLRDLVYRGVARSGVPHGVSPVLMERIDWLDDDSAAAAESHILLESLALSFETPYGDILRWHIGEGESLLKVAARLGCSRRTVTRRWRVILARLRSELRAEPVTV